MHWHEAKKKYSLLLYTYNAKSLVGSLYPWGIPVHTHTKYQLQSLLLSVTFYTSVQKHKPVDLLNVKQEDVDVRN